MWHVGAVTVVLHIVGMLNCACVLGIPQVHQTIKLRVVVVDDKILSAGGIYRAFQRVVFVLRVSENIINNIVRTANCFLILQVFVLIRGRRLPMIYFVLRFPLYRLPQFCRYSQ